MAVIQIETLQDGIALIRLNRPQKINAMNAELMQALFDAFATVSNDNSCRVAILSGAGPGFCSGLDLDDSGMIPNTQGLSIPQLSIRAVRHFSRVVPAMRAVRQPLICAIHGPAYGGGMCLCLGADIRIAAHSARFNSTGIVNGLTSTELGVSWILPRLIGASRATEIMLSGRVVESEEAERIGLIARRVPDSELLESAVQTAQRICELSPLGVQMTKQLCWSSLEIPGLEAAIELEDRNQLLLGMTSNLDEAKRARREKRSPHYRDKPTKWPEEWT